MDLAKALASDPLGGVMPGRIKQIYTNGTCDVDLGAGRVISSASIAGWYTPITGDAVLVEKLSDGQWHCRGPVRTFNQTTVAVGRVLTIPWNVRQSAPALANPLVVSVASTHSWRNTEGWAVSIGDTVAQGAYSSTYGYYRGCYFYGGSAFTGLAGRTCTRLRIKLVRTGSGGSAGATQQIIQPHTHPSQPADQPYFADSAFNAGSLGWSSSGVFDLPTSWGQALINGTYFGFGHNLLATGNGNYSLNAGAGADATTGQITLDWS